MSKSLQSKIRRYRRLQQQLPQLERQIKAETRPLLLENGLLASPRIERIVEMFG